MKFVFYTHSLVSDWNHGNAHFLRGIMRELQAAGHHAVALEPANGWSRRNLLREQGQPALARFAARFPDLLSVEYDDDFEHEAFLADADVVVVHEWTEPALVARIGRARRHGFRFTLIFHDTHHRAVSRTTEMTALELEDYDLVLAFGEALRERYLAAGWGRQVRTWHEAADTSVFRPIDGGTGKSDLLWIGNWGDGERSEELKSFLLSPARRLGLSGSLRGVRYPETALEAIRQAGLHYGGWIANCDVPDAFSRHRLTVHVPRRPYVRSLPGIPTIRVFEALACGIPLVSAPWSDVERLFRPQKDFLMVRDEAGMVRALSAVLADGALAAELAASGLETIRARHTCRHRVQELLALLAQQGTARARTPLAAAEVRP